VNYLPLAPPGVTPPRVLTIAGSDSGGGAGMQADIRTCTLLGVHTLCAVTAVTVQNTVGVKDFHPVPPDVVAAQIAAVCDDIGPQAAKTGMLATAEIIEAIAQSWREHGAGVPLVVDPVCASMHGDALLDGSALNALRTELFPLATLVTPNLHEVRLLVEIDVVDSTTQAEAARALHTLGPGWAMVKGGHLQGSASSTDLLFDGNDFHELESPRVNTTHDHGAGDTLAAATACALAHGYALLDAVAFGKGWVTEGLRASYPLGHGHGPVSPLFRLQP
jgi:hydroxymethylpyrimidine/phosphomethylpyrimidine kinase